MKVGVRTLLGLGGVPKDRTSASKWMAKRGIPTFSIHANGRDAEAVNLSDLPEAVRRAYLVKHIDGLDLDPGTYDDTAHAAFLDASPRRRQRAERKAEVARFMLALPAGTTMAERIRLVQAKFGSKGHSKPALMAVLSQVQGVDPINFAPALLDKSNAAGRPATGIPEMAWRCFLTLIRDAAPEWPLVAAWRDVEEIALKMGWGAVPSYLTFMRRWNALPEAQRLQARLGKPACKRKRPCHSINGLPMLNSAREGRSTSR